MEDAIVSGVVGDDSEAKITITQVPDRPGVSAKVFRALASADVNVDMIVQNVSEQGHTDISFTLPAGELATVLYDVVNTHDKPVAGQAIPSYAPQHASRYFRKLECFCFRQQALAAGESKRFPVVFVLDPNLPKDVTTITLSYTFFEIAGPVGAPQASGDGRLRADAAPAPAALPFTRGG